MAFDQEKDATYRVPCAVEGEEFAAPLFELSESRKNIIPGRNPNRVHLISVLEISHGEVNQGLIWIAIDREFVPDLSNRQQKRGTSEHERERERRFPLWVETLPL